MRFHKYQKRLLMSIIPIWILGYSLFNLYELLMIINSDNHNYFDWIKFGLINFIIMGVIIFTCKNEIKIRTKSFFFRFLSRKYISMRNVASNHDDFNRDYYIHSGLMDINESMFSEKKDYSIKSYTKRTIWAILKLSIKVVSLILVFSFKIDINIIVRSLIQLPFLIALTASPMICVKLIFKKLVKELQKSVDYIELNFNIEYNIHQHNKDFPYLDEFVSPEQYLRRETFVGFFETAYTVIVTSASSEWLDQYYITKDTSTLIFKVILPILLLVINMIILIILSKNKSKQLKLENAYDIHSYSQISDERIDPSINYLPHFLNNILPSDDWKFNKTVNLFRKKNTKVDAYSKHLKTIVIIETFKYYTNPNLMLQEAININDSAKKGFHLIYIPYFLQPSTYLAKVLFNSNIKYKPIYKHGFLYSINQFPSYFCDLGSTKFNWTMREFHFIRDEILKSMIVKMIEFKSIESIIPLSMCKCFDHISIDFIWKEY